MTAKGASSAQAREEPNRDELEALGALGDGGTWSVDGDELEVSNLDKVLFPASGSEPEVTKRELIEYYTLVAPHLLPYLRGRPVNRHRFPDGVDEPGFWEKALPRNAPEWMNRWHDSDAEPGRTAEYAVIDRVASLAFMANEASIELHPWTSCTADVSKPTWALIDIDPGSATDFDDVLTLARLHRVALDQLGLRAMPKVTGKRGVHIWIPVAPNYSFDDTRDWVEALSRSVGKVVPDLISWSWRKKDRRGRARLDYTQNAPGNTLVAPLGVRASPGAPVSMPIEWDELDDPELRSDGWTIRTALARLDGVGDPLRPLIGFEQDLPSLETVHDTDPERSEHASGAGRRASEADNSGAEERRSKADLYDEAKRRGIEGRSKMNRAELEIALSRE